MTEYKRQNSQSLGDIIQQYIKNMGIQPKLDELNLVNKWEEIVGPMVAKHTAKLYIKNKKLFLKFDSSALRQEVSYAKSKLIDNINSTIGREIIDDIVLL